MFNHHRNGIARPLYRRISNKKRVVTFGLWPVDIIDNSFFALGFGDAFNLNCSGFSGHAAKLFI